MTLSVTEILSLAIGYVMGHVPDEIMRHAQERGTAVHSACHYDDEGDLDESALDPEVVPYVEAWRKFKRDMGVVLVAFEQCFESKRYIFHGHPDRIAIIKGRRGVIDIKATAALSPITAIQTAGYAIAYEEMSGEKIAYRCAVQLKPDGAYQVDWHEDKNDRNTFLAALVVAQWKRRYLS